MSWEHRPYAHDSNSYGGGPARSWLGGLPPLSQAVKWIMIANGVLFLLCLFTGGTDSRLYSALEMRTDLVLRGQIWRIVTFTYLHDQASLAHIFFNMLGLYFLGVNLERTWGSRQFFIFYTLGGFVAVALYLMVTLVGWLPPGIPLVGASGGVLAVMGACAVLFPQFQLIFFLFPVPIRTAVLIFALFFSFNLVSRGMNAGGDACHLAGMAFGVAWGYRGRSWWGSFETWRDRLRQRTDDARRLKERSAQSEIDRILDKVHHHGIASLTRTEKRFLEETTQRQQRETSSRR
jgi:membrane associated rhomboid family serine protease